MVIVTKLAKIEPLSATTQHCSQYRHKIMTNTIEAQKRNRAKIMFKKESRPEKAKI